MAKQRFYRKMFAAFILIVLIFNLIASGVLYYKNSEIVDIKLNGARQMFLEQNAERLDNQLLVAEGLYNQLLLNEFVSKYIHSVEKDFYNITMSNKVIGKYVDPFQAHGYKIDMFKLSENVVITPYSTMDNERYYADLGLTPRQKSELLAFSVGESADAGKQLVIPGRADDARGHAFSIVRKEKRGRAEAAIIVTSFNDSFLPELSAATDGFAILHEGQLLSSVSGTNLKAIPELLDQYHKRVEAEEEETQSYGQPRYHTVQEFGYTIHSLGSSVRPDWQYIYVTDDSEARPGWASLLRESTIAAIVLGVLGITLSHLMTNRTYRPIRQIAATMKGDNNGGEEDDLLYIQETTAQIRGANEALRATIARNQLPLKKNFMRDLVYGLADESAMSDGIERHGLGLLSGPVTAVIVECANKRQMDDHYSKEAIQDILSQAVRVIEAFLKEEMECEHVELDYNRHVFLAGDGSTENVRKLFHSILTSIESEYDIRFIAAVGSASQDPADVERSFRAALRLLEYRFSLDKRLVITQDDIADLHELHFYYPLEMERELVDGVMTGKTSRTNAILDELLRENVQERQLNPDVLNQFVFAVASTVNRIMQQFNKQEREAFGSAEHVYGELMKWETPEQLRERIVGAFRSLSEVRRQASEQSDNRMAASMMQFIGEYYNRDISLSDIADHFRITPGYVSTLFKKYTGENFKNHLNIYRVQKAKEIISAQPVKINELATMVGCNNTDTFIRIFKKYEGVSPGQYIRDQQLSRLGEQQEE